LEKDKNKRYQKAGEVRSSLEKIEEGATPTSEQAPGRVSRTSREITVTIGLRKLWVPALAVVGLAVLAVAILKVLPKKDIPPSESFKTSIAVLPFEDLSPDKDQAFLCDGISESLINALTKIQDLRIPARTSSFSFKGGDHDIQEIGERLNVKTVLEGSVQRAGNELRVTVKLINVSDESVQWSEQYNKTLKDMFTIQDEITLNVVEELKVKLTGGELERLTRRETTSLEAYQLYLQGRYFRWIENKENFFKAKNYFEQAIDKDPNYSSAYAGLADIYMLLGLFSMMSRDEAARLAYDAAKKALELDENSSEAHTSMGVILEVFEWDWRGAEREFKRAVALNPNHFDAHYEYGFLLFRLKRLDEAELELEKSVQIDPLSYRGHSVLSSIYHLKGDLEKAEAQKKISEELNTQIVSGKNEVEIAQKLIEREGRLPNYLFQLAKAYIQSGQEAEARTLRDELERTYKESNVGDIAFNTALVYLYLGEKDQALRWLERSYEKHDPYFMTINTNTYLDPIRQDPRFRSIVKKIGLE
jgi:TolB-like protein/Tfp pilus assembly protein PilF